MSSSYNQNIERMRSRERANVQQGNAQRTAMANIMGQRGIQEAAQINKSLEAFSVATISSAKVPFIDSWF